MTEHPLDRETCKALATDDCGSVYYSYADMRAAYDRAVEDVIRITQGQGWSDYEGTLYYPDDVGIENIGDAIKRELYSQQQQQQENN